MYLHARSDARLVSGIMNGETPIALSFDLGEIIFLYPRLQKVTTHGSMCQIGVNLTRLQRVGGELVSKLQCARQNPHGLVNELRA